MSSPAEVKRSEREDSGQMSFNLLSSPVDRYPRSLGWTMCRQVYAGPFSTGVIFRVFTFHTFHRSYL